jgi:cardiolipin synthase
MVEAIRSARESVRLESYIYSVGQPGDSIREALQDAARRGVKVWVLVDALGSMNTPDSHWDALREAGASFAWFNPLALDRLAFRNHRKLLICDEAVAFIGGFNLAPEYAGDGVTKGWRDLGMEMRGALVPELVRSFHDMLDRADFLHPRLQRLRRPFTGRHKELERAILFQSCPGRGRNPMKGALQRDLRAARDVRILAAYFLPTLRLRRALHLVARRGGRVQLILPGPCDIPLSQLAAQSLYPGLFRAGVEVHEYQPQILHAKLIIIDDAVYVGSANLDTRSLHINYELLVRVQDPVIAAQAREIFAGDLAHCRRVDPVIWRRSSTFWTRLRQRWARFLLATVDPYVARQQLRVLR